MARQLGDKSYIYKTSGILNNITGCMKFITGSPFCKMSFLDAVYEES